MYDCQSLSIRQRQKRYIVPISADIVSQITQGSKLQMFFKDSLSEVVLRKNEP
jgi:hypothetical protein